MKSIVRLIISVFCFTTILFSDPTLFKDGTISSDSCHDLLNGDDGLKFSFGIGGEG